MEFRALYVFCLNASVFDRAIKSEFLCPSSDFFELFSSFEGFVDFFALQDLVDSKYSTVKFFLPFDETFPLKPFPKDLDEYDVFIRNTLGFVLSRTKRLTNYSQEFLESKP